VRQKEEFEVNMEDEEDDIAGPRLDLFEKSDL
jgi:hypothetical protein